MKLAAPVSAALLATIAWVAPQDPLPNPLLGHAKALSNAEGLRAEVTVLPPAGGEEQVTLLMGKQASFRLDGPRRLLVADGADLADLDKKSNSYSRKKADAPVAALAEEPAAWLFFSFFEADTTKLFKAGKKLNARKVGGVEADSVQVVLADGSNATFFVGRESGLALGGTFTRNGGEWLVLVREIELLKEAPGAGEFAFAPPAGATEMTTQAAAAGWAGVSKIFQGNCMPCHGANMAGGLDLRTYAAAAKSRSIVPGNPAASSMVGYIRGTRTPRMPIGRAPLSEADMKTVEEWIAGGAKQ